MLVIRENVVTSEFMNILIEDAETLQYLTSNSQWTKNASKAKTSGPPKRPFRLRKKNRSAGLTSFFTSPKTRQFINMDHGRGKGLAEASPVLETAPAA